MRQVGPYLLFQTILVQFLVMELLWSGQFVEKFTPCLYRRLRRGKTYRLYRGRKDLDGVFAKVFYF